jgi:hypothetical protein
MAQDGEMILTIPPGDLPLALEGLRHSKEHGRGLPLKLGLEPEYRLAPSYVEIGKMMGMDWVK